MLFPRIFALAVSKHGLVSSFGKWEDGIWIWKVQLSQRPFDWEVKVWEGFNQVLEEIVLVEESKDKIVWSHLVSDNYSCKSFREELCINFHTVPI